VGGIIPMLVPFAAGNFIYIAASDLIPEMHKSDGIARVTSILVFSLGVLFMYVIAG
jgi:zinc and cadmium transporter